MRFRALLLLFSIATGTMTMPSQTNAQERFPAASSSTDPIDEDLVQALKLEVAHLQSSIDTWNDRYIGWLIASIITAAISIVVIFGTVSSQFKTIRLSRELSDRQSLSDRAKDRIRASRDSLVAEDLKTKDVEIGKANEAAGKANERAASIKREADEKIADLNHQTEILKLGAERDKRDSEAKIAALNLQTEQLRSANLELQVSITPRVFKDQMKAVNELTPFAGTRMLLAYETDDETWDFACQIAFILQSARWDVTYRPLHGEGVPLGGVSVADGGKAGDKLIDELQAGGVDAKRRTGAPVLGLREFALVVGHKPNRLNKQIQALTDKLETATPATFPGILQELRKAVEAAGHGSSFDNRVIVPR